MDHVPRLARAALLAAGNALGNKGTSLWLVAVPFVVGALCSGLAGLFGMRVATAANMRTTNGAREGLQHALQVAFSGGAVMGMCVVGLGVLGLSVLFIVFATVFGSEVDILFRTTHPGWLAVLLGFRERRAFSWVPDSSLRNTVDSLRGRG